jgi:predicted transcriptional regulator
VIRRARGPVSVDEAAETLGVHRNVARGRLERLAAAGLVQTRFQRRSGGSGPGAGRPAKLYSAAPQSEALEFPAHHLPELVAELLDELPGAGRRSRSARPVGASATASRHMPTCGRAATSARRSKPSAPPSESSGSTPSFRPQTASGP